jgi:DNA repair protein RadA/Sms
MKAAAPARRSGWAGKVDPPKVTALKDVSHSGESRVSTGIGELDRVLGGGMVAGSVVLVGGDPGIGKSTLLLQAVSKMAASLPALYVTGEESLAQVAARGARIGLGLTASMRWLKPGSSGSWNRPSRRSRGWSSPTRSRPCGPNR